MTSILRRAPRGIFWGRRNQLGAKDALLRLSMREVACRNQFALQTATAQGVPLGKAADIDLREDATLAFTFPIYERLSVSRQSIRRTLDDEQASKLLATPIYEWTLSALV
jgi:hypothetical protein